MSGGRALLRRMFKMPPPPAAGAVCVAWFAAVALHAQSVVFISQNRISAGADPSALALANLGASGQNGLLIANQRAASLSVLRNVGNGFFTPITTQSTGAGPRAIAVADFNRDGNLDVAVANFAADNVEVLLGNGNGTFR